MGQKNIYSRLFHYIAPSWKQVALGVLGYGLYSGIDATFTYLVQPLLNKGFVLKDPDFLHRLPWLIIGLFLLRGGANLLANASMVWASRTTINRIRMDLFNHFLQLPSQFYAKSNTGQLLSLIMFNVDQLSSMFGDVTTSLIQSGSLVIGLLIVMLLTQWKLTLLLMLLIPIMTWVMRAISFRLKKLNQKIQEGMANMTQSVDEALNGMDVIRIYGAQDREAQKFQSNLTQHRQHEVKVAITHSAGVLGMQILAACMLSMTIILAAHPQSIFSLTAGEFVSMMAAMLAMLKPLRDLSRLNAIMQKGLVAASAIFQCLDEPTERRNTSEMHWTQPVAGRIEIQHLKFSYPQTHMEALDDIHLTIQPGQMVALVGPSGGGKSTLIKLLLGFYSPNSGNILLDGLNIENISLKELRAQFSVVSQQVTLFHDTVFNNIAYGLPNACTFEQIKEAACSADALEFIEQLPQGWDTVVGDNGFNLSGGQRQRLALARAILKNAPILILDEATSALDAQSELNVQRALEKHHQGRHTYLVVAHRLSTIQKADWIVVIEGGKIIEQGTPQQLLIGEGLYSRLHQLQWNEVRV